MTVEMGDVNYLRHFSYFYIKYVWSRMQNLHEFFKKEGTSKKTGFAKGHFERCLRTPGV